MYFVEKRHKRHFSGSWYWTWYNSSQQAAKRGAQGKELFDITTATEILPSSTLSPFSPWAPPTSPLWSPWWCAGRREGDQAWCGGHLEETRRVCSSYQVGVLVVIITDFELIWTIEHISCWCRSVCLSGYSHSSFGKASCLSLRQSTSCALHSWSPPPRSI